MDHRAYPGAPYDWKGRPAGMCKWCGTYIYNRSGVLLVRRMWHTSCAQQFKIRAWPDVGKSHVYRRDKGLCAKCGKFHPLMFSKAWQLEHAKPLALAQGDPSYWEPENLRIYCVEPCHREKTKEDLKAIRAHKLSLKSDAD